MNNEEFAEFEAMGRELLDGLAEQIKEEVALGLITDVDLAVDPEYLKWQRYVQYANYCKHEHVLNDQLRQRTTELLEENRVQAKMLALVEKVVDLAGRS